MLNRRDIRRIFREHRGALARVSKQLDVDPSHVSHWLRGDRDSSVVEQACRKEAERLLRGNHD